MSVKTPAATLPTTAIHSQEGSLANFEIEPLFFIRQIRNLCWSSSSDNLFFETNITGRFNLWRVSSTGGWPVQLGVSENRTVLVESSRNGKFLLYTQDQDGNEKPNLYLMSTKGGKSYSLTDTVGVGYESIHLSFDSQYVAFSAELESKGQYGIYTNLVPTIPFTDKELSKPKTIISPAGKMWGGCVWSKSGKYLAVTHTIDSLHNGVGYTDLLGNYKELIPDDGFHSTDIVSWGERDKKILINSNISPTGQVAPALVSLETGEIEWLVQSVWEATALDWSDNGKHIAWKLNVAGSETLYVLDSETRSERRVPLEEGVFGAVKFSPDSSKISFVYGNATRPADIWVYDIASNDLKQISYALVGGLAPENFTKPQIITYQSYDGTAIAAYLYIPKGLKAGVKNPGLVMIRGGPTAQTQNQFSRDIQYLVSQGYVVIAPNYRGSTGFGRDFQESNRRDLGGGDLQDIVAAHWFLVSTGMVDAERIGVMGGSYGGYLTLMALTKFPELWSAAVAIVPFANWFTEYENEDETLQAFDRMMMGDPIKDRDFWIDRSPYFFVDRIRSPLLMLAGGNDIRCPASETLEIARKIKESGGIVDAKIYEDEGHGFLKRENSIDAFARTVNFLLRHLQH